MNIAYKLTRRDMTTHEGFVWPAPTVDAPGEWVETSGEDELCGPGWLHFYTHPLLAVLFNPIHANIADPLLFEAEVKGKFKDDCGIKVGYTRARLVRALPLPVLTTEQLVTIAIRCALAVYQNPGFARWANDWISGTDRSARAADAAGAAANAARAADAAGAAANAARAADAAGAATYAAHAASAAACAARAAADAAYAANAAANAAAYAAYAAGAATYATYAAAYAGNTGSINLISIAEGKDPQRGQT